MKHIYIGANWKSNKTVEESLAWYEEFAALSASQPDIVKDRSVILCVPYTNLYPLKLAMEKTPAPVELGAQDVSPYPEGAYTGQISARMIHGLAAWVIIGHSERRKYFRETDEDLFRKVGQVKDAGMKVMYCISDPAMPVPPDTDIIAYEPVWAIGTGKTDSPENAAAAIAEIKKASGVQKALYGGSVTPDNVSGFVHAEPIDGVLIGGASLDPKKFVSLIQHASA